MPPRHGSQESLVPCTCRRTARDGTWSHGPVVWLDHSSAAQIPGMPALRRVRTGREHTRAAPGEKLGMQKLTLALGLLQPDSSQHLQCHSNQRSQKSPLRMVLSGRRKEWSWFPTPHLVARAVVSNPACDQGNRVKR